MVAQQCWNYMYLVRARLLGYILELCRTGACEGRGRCRWGEISLLPGHLGLTINGDL